MGERRATSIATGLQGKAVAGHSHGRLEPSSSHPHCNSPPASTRGRFSFQAITTMPEPSHTVRVATAAHAHMLFMAVLVKRAMLKRCSPSAAQTAGHPSEIRVTSFCCVTTAGSYVHFAL